MRLCRQINNISRMENPLSSIAAAGHRQWLSPRPLTRPDWPLKHEEGSKARNLLPYILEPQKYSDRVIRDSPDSVLIQDKYPKAHVHLLVLPKWQPHRDLHPHDAFEDPEFLAMVRREACEGLKLAMPLLRSTMQKALKKSGVDRHTSQALLNQRDFSKDFQIGIHAHPSQHELHVHIISRDMVSWHKYSHRHYQAFNTPFLVPLVNYPLPPKAEKREVEFQNNNLMKEDFQCWRCGEHFELHCYEDLQDHLREEWQLWIREGLDLLVVSDSAGSRSKGSDAKLPETDPTRL